MNSRNSTLVPTAARIRALSAELGDAVVEDVDVADRTRVTVDCRRLAGSAHMPSTAATATASTSETPASNDALPSASTATK